jgi:K+-sensing histidine kinase KdpD
MKRKTAVIFYLLGGYVLLQFAWWAFHLITLTQNKVFEQSEASNKVFMILSEGLVFFLLILVGLWYIRRSIKKELRFSERQKNFLLSVTHELKTPIAANKLLLQTLRKREMDQATQHDLLDRALAENERLDHLIENILQATQIDNSAIQLHFESISIQNFVEDVTQTYASTQQLKNIEIRGKSAAIVELDQATASIVLINLLDNARKYGGDTECIILEIKEDEQKICLSVMDEGSGIPENMQVEIFNKFVRLGSEETRQKKGTGLGLFIAKEFAALNRADLRYDNSYQSGAKFDFKIRK